MSQKLTSV